MTSTASVAENPTPTSVPAKRKKSKKKFLKAKTKVEIVDPKGSVVDDALFDAIVTEIKSQVPGAFVPHLGVKLAEVSAYIPMPKALCEVMDLDGLPCGQIIQTVGDSDTGKTTFCNHALIECQKAGGIAVLIDTEHKYDIKRAVAMGLNRDRLVWKKARTIEEAFTVLIRTLKIIRDRAPKALVVVVWDSIGGTPCLREVEGTGADGEDEDEKNQSSEYAPAAAKAIKGGLRKTRYFIQEMNAAFLMINQFYTRTDLSGPAAKFAKKKKAYGGEGPKYFSSVVLEFTRIGTLSHERKGKKIKFGIESQVECVKNHLGQPFRVVEVEIDKYGVVGADRRAGDAPEGLAPVLEAAK